ncbi:MAG TPA: GNAT family N-acyltransferase [Beijerinckiaceae bacterium]|nr:GNAT family N-acyltransferase [Beijerinckiaceae bacterium]
MSVDAVAAARRGARALRFPAILPGRRVVRDLDGLPQVLGRIGSLEVRLAVTAQDIRRAQRLRYAVFYEEMSATPSAKARLSRRDSDPFDRICDHLLVIDHAFRRTPGARPRAKVVGTYRLLRQACAERNGGFYSAAEFDLRGLIAAHPGQHILELGRSCVLKPYRNKRTVELLWHGIWRYVRHHDVDLMVGCASLEGTDPAELAVHLSFLHHHARAPAEWQVSALPSRYVGMNRLRPEAFDAKKALASLPPLIKGYLRLGARYGEGAVVDRQFGTTDVFVVLRVADINPRYIEFYGENAERHAA